MVGCLRKLVVGVLLLVSTTALGQTVTIPYQGHLNSNGVGVNSLQSMRFEVFGQESGGTVLETINQDVPVFGGVFTVNLPVSPATLDAPTLFLQISVGPVGGTLVQLAGRQRVYPAPLAHRASPEAVFKANGVTTPSLTVTPATGPTTTVGQAGVSVGNFTIGPNALVTAPTMRSVELVTDNQGIVSSAERWNIAATQCANGRPGCYNVDVPFTSNGGTVVMTVESTGFRPAAGLAEIFLILNPDAGGVGYNAGALRQFMGVANQHMAFPTFSATLPTQFTTCGTPPCNNLLRIVTRSNSAGPATNGVCQVDANDYLRVTMVELPYVTVVQ